MKKMIKKLTALFLSAAMVVVQAGAVTEDGKKETWFDLVWELIGSYGLKAENNPYVLQNYINKYLQRHPEEMYNVINDILSLLDTHSMYLSSEQYTKGFGSLEGYVGIGISMQETEQGVQIAEITKYSAAEEAGLAVGDIIIKVDDKDATKMHSTDIAELLRGKEGETVRLTVRRGDEVLKFSCVRRQMNHIYVSASTMADGVEYIKVGAMGSQDDWTAFSEIWQGLDEKNTRAVILDLRGNGGGVIDVALKIADAMTQEKDVYLAGIHWRKDMGGLQKTNSKGGGLPLNKVVVLVDGGTASAAELLAGSLRDTGTATLIGEKTYGKGQGQYHLDMINGDKLVITTLELELPKQGVYEGVGLTPDKIVSNRVVTINAAQMKPLDTTRPLYFGERSDAVYAMTERLALFGLIDGATDTFDGKVLDAVSAFQQAYSLTSDLCASTDMLQSLDEAVKLLDGRSHKLDDQLQAALQICMKAAEEPQKYTVLPDGSWKKK